MPLPSMVPLLGAIRSASLTTPSSITTYLSHFRGRSRLTSSSSSAIIQPPSLPFSKLNKGFLSLRASFNSRTREGIPRVSCLTNPLEKCVVCSKAIEHGNKNKRLNTSLIIRYAKASENTTFL